MTKRLTGIPSLAYMGIEASQPPNMVTETRAPTPNDRFNFNVGDFWMVKSPQQLWWLSSLANKTAAWIQLYPAANPGGADQFPADTGTANEVGGVLNILGGTGISTEATPDGGNTITINSNLTNNDGLITITPDAGPPHGYDIDLVNGTNGQVLIGGGSQPAWANLTAGSNISITNGANSITIAGTSAGVTNASFFALLNTSITNFANSGALTTIVFESLSYGTLPGYSTVTGIYTAPVNGRYLFNTAILFEGTNKTVVFFEHVSGITTTRYIVQAYMSSAIATLGLSATGSLTITLTAGDTIRVRLVTSATTTYLYGQTSIFTSILVDAALQTAVKTYFSGVFLSS